MFLLGYLKGGDTFRLMHGHTDDCLAVPPVEHGEEARRSASVPVSLSKHMCSLLVRSKVINPPGHVCSFSLSISLRSVCFEGGPVSSEARSLWHLETMRVA